MAEKQVRAILADDHLDKVEQVAERLSQAGLRVQQRMDVLGYVYGTVDDANQAQLETVPGVAKVEDLAEPSQDPQRTYRISES